MKKILTLLLCLLPLGLSAQILEPIHWSANVVALSDSTASVQLTARIDDGWHLYTQDLPEGGPVATAFSYAKGIRLIGKTTTKAKVLSAYDENFEMTLTYYEKTATFTQKIRTKGLKSVSGSVYFMACNDQQCLAPKNWEWTAAIPAFQAETANDTEVSQEAAATNASIDSSESSSVVATVETNPQGDVAALQETASSSDVDYIGKDRSLLWIFAMGLLAGLLAIFTPCVWPIIPMTVSFFLKRADRAEKTTGVSQGKKGLRDACLYGLSIIVIYVGLGLLVTVLFGASALNALSTNLWVNLLFFLILVIFALSFFGLFEITLPSSWSTRLDSRSSSAAGFLSIFFMAFTLVIVSFSCTGPIIGTLLVAAAGKSLLAPSIGMLGFALALAAPFTLFAMFPGFLKKAPKSGDWMKSFKVTLAFLELALSLKFLSVADMAFFGRATILPRWLFIALWVVIFLAAGIYLIWGIWRVTTVRKIIRGVIAAASLCFAFYLIPGLHGAPVKAIAAFAPPMPIEDRAVFSDYEEGLAYARQENKPVLLDFTGLGCVNCRKMEAYVLSDDSVKAHLQHYVLISLYVDVKEDGIGEKNSKIQADIYHANAQPYYIQLNSQGEPISRPYAFSTNPEDFLRWLKY